MKCGEQYVMTSGLQMMQVLPANNLDTRDTVILIVMVICLYIISFFIIDTISAGGLFGKGTGPILLDNVDCTSSEDRLIDCNYDSHTADCGHREDVGLRCDANREW